MTEESAPTIDVRPAALFSAVVLLFLAAISAYAWSQLPEGSEIPVHWGVDGEPDRYGGKAEGLLLMPGIAVGVSLLLYVIPKFEPRKLHMAGSRQAYIAIWMGVMALFGAIHVTAVLAALGRDVNMSLIVPSLVGVLFLVIGNFMSKMRSNWFMGIRTPWTLSSERSWNKTHRLGARFFIAMGVLMLAMPWLPPSPWSVGLVMAPIGGMVVFLFVYSYLVWRADPDKLPLGR